MRRGRSLVHIEQTLLFRQAIQEKLLRCPPFNLKYFLLALTAFVPAALWSAGKKYAAAWSQITDAREEQKRSRYEQSPLLIKDFKYGPLLSILTEKVIRRRTVKRPLIFHHDNNAARVFDSGSVIKT